MQDRQSTLHRHEALSDGAETRWVDCRAGRLAYRTFGTESGAPLVLLHRFRATIDEWDPLLLDALAAERRVVLFDSAGVGLSTGQTPETIAGMAEVAVELIDALDLPQVDLLGWSMGGAVAQILALQRPERVRRLVLAGTGPGGFPDAPRPPDKVWQVARKPANDDEDFLYLFFDGSPGRRAAGIAHLARLHHRREPPAPAVCPESVRAQGVALGAWFSGKDASFPRLAEIRPPALVAGGSHDVMVPAFNSYVLAQGLRDAELALYRDSGHGFLFQHAERFARQVCEFLRP